jgi:hypothetical protein
MTTTMWWESPAALADFLAKAHAEAEATSKDESVDVAIRYARAAGHLLGAVPIAIDTLRQGFHPMSHAVPVEVVNGPLGPTPCGTICADAGEACSTCVDIKDVCHEPLDSCTRCEDCREVSRAA